MRRAIAILLGVALLSGADAVFARGGRAGGGFHGGGTSMGFHGGRGGKTNPGAQIRGPLGRPFSGGCPAVLCPPPLFHPPPPFVCGTRICRGRVFFPLSPYPAP